MMGLSRTLALLTAVTAMVGPAKPISAQSAVDDGLSADSPVPARIVRVGVSAGGGAMISGGGAAGVRGAVAWSLSDRTSLTIRAALMEEMELFGPTPVENVWDVGMLIGRETGKGRGYASASAGLALVGGTRRGAFLSSGSDCDVSGFMGWGCAFVSALTPDQYEALTFRTVGIPFEAEVGVTLAGRLGFSLGVWGNVNPERSMVGLALGLVLGDLR